MGRLTKTLKKEKGGGDFNMKMTDYLLTRIQAVTAGAKSGKDHLSDAEIVEFAEALEAEAKALRALVD